MNGADLSFVDTNIFVYAMQRVDPNDLSRIRKREIAIKLLIVLVAANAIVISTQVLGEFYNAITRKGNPPLAPSDASAGIDLLSQLPVMDTDVSLVLEAVQRCQRYQIAYYDSLMIGAALRAGASVLYSEDMQDGMRYGSLEIRNPFKKSAASQ